MRTIKAVVPAWLSRTYYDPAQLFSDEEARVVEILNYTALDMTTSGWVKVGEAEMTLTISVMADIIENKVEALKAEKTNVLAKAHAEATRLEGMIQQLLAIEYKPEKETNHET